MKNILILLLCIFAQASYSQTGKALFDEGEKLYKEDRYNEAFAKLAEAEKSGYKEAILYIIRGNCYLRLNKSDEAITNYDKAIAIDPKNTRALFNRGIVNRGNDKYDLAVKDFTSVLAIDKNYKDAYQYRGAVYLQGNKLQKAIDDFKSYIELDNTNDLVYAMLAAAYTDLGGKANLKKAAEAFTATIALNGNDADYYYSRGYIYMDLWEDDKAGKDFDEALKLNPGHADAWFEKGNYYQRKKNIDKQIECYTKAISIKPDSDRFYYWRGRAYIEKKDKEKACADFTKSRELGNKDAEAYKSMCDSKGSTLIITD